MMNQTEKEEYMNDRFFGNYYFKMAIGIHTISSITVPMYNIPGTMMMIIMYQWVNKMMGMLDPSGVY